MLCGISGLGGAEISLLELVARLRDSYEFHLIVPGEGLLKESAEQAGATVWVLAWPDAIAGAGETARRPSAARMMRSAMCLGAFARRLSRVLDEIRPSAVVTNAAKAHVIGSLARKRKHVPLIWYMRDGLKIARFRDGCWRCWHGAAIWQCAFPTTWPRNSGNTSRHRCRQTLSATLSI